MKVIALIDYETYVCEVSHGEIEKFMDLYFNNLAKLKVGSEVDLGKGHDFNAESASALKKTAEFIGENRKVLDSIQEMVLVADRMTRSTKKKGAKNDTGN